MGGRSINSSQTSMPGTLTGITCRQRASRSSLLERHNLAHLSRIQTEDLWICMTRNSLYRNQHPLEVATSCQVNATRCHLELIGALAALTECQRVIKKNANIGSCKRSVACCRSIINISWKWRRVAK